MGDQQRPIAALFEEHGDAVYRLGLRMCEDPGFAEDLVQETFLRAQRNWASFEGRAQPLTWLYTIASRACQRLQRRRAGQPCAVASLQALLDLESDHELNSGSRSESPLEAAVRSDEAERLHSSISALPASFRLPLVLKEIEGLTVAEVSEILGIGEATVKTRLHRARLTLRRDLASAPQLSPVDVAGDSERQCSDLLAAKLEAMARGVPFPVENERICAQCRSTLDALDRTRDLCVSFPTHPLPDRIRERVSRTLRDFDGR